MFKKNLNQSQYKPVRLIIMKDSIAVTIIVIIKVLIQPKEEFSKPKEFPVLIRRRTIAVLGKILFLKVQFSL